MTLPHLQPASLSQAQLLATLAAQTLAETYCPQEIDPDSALYIGRNLSVQAFEAILKQPAAFPLIWLAYAQSGEAVGYMQLNRSYTPQLFENQQVIQLKRIYVLRSHQQQKLGKALLAQAQQLAIDQKMEGIWLICWTDNHQAIAFYKKNGFVEKGTHPFQVGDTTYEDLIFYKSFSPTN
ncbi:MAG TPA: hypothetical protein DCM08_11495 [Microscillaceae bacterium]|nr:hypothetical protein [Microscillaceae bacterium]